MYLQLDIPPRRAESVCAGTSARSARRSYSFGILEGSPGRRCKSTTRETGEGELAAFTSETEEREDNRGGGGRGSEGDRKASRRHRREREIEGFPWSTGRGRGRKEGSCGWRRRQERGFFPHQACNVLCTLYTVNEVELCFRQRKRDTEKRWSPTLSFLLASARCSTLSMTMRGEVVCSQRGTGEHPPRCHSGR